MPLIASVSEFLHNTKAKMYPDGSREITVCNRAIFRDSGWEELEKKPEQIILSRLIPSSKPKSMANDMRGDSIRRAINAIIDIVRMNPGLFTHFITWTLDKEKIDRYDPKEVSKKLLKFLNNMVSRYGFHYLIIAEYHKDGAIHMHGLISGNIRLIDSGHKTKSKDSEESKTIYNMPQWTLGYSTAIELTGDIMRTARYITKYITKDTQKIFGKLYYAGGKSLVRKPPVDLYDTDYSQIESKEYECKEANRRFKYLSEGANEVDVTKPNDPASGNRGISNRPANTGEQFEDLEILQTDADLFFEQCRTDYLAGDYAFPMQEILYPPDNEEPFLDNDSNIYPGIEDILDMVLP